jgi:superfamily I DNA/RNA helicase
MESSWWKSRNELDDAQEAIIMLPADGRYVVTGPPGCGKTNLLVLRAAYLNKAKFKNLTLLTFGVALSDFIRTGVKGKGLDPEQINTHVRWGRAMAVSHNPDSRATIDGIPKLSIKRHAIAAECQAAVNLLGDAAKIHQVILVDEIQDLFADELDVIAGVAPRIMLAGDSKQSVYQGGNALTHAKTLGFVEHRLTTHYRIGHSIAKVADRIFEPTNPADSLVASCNYDEQKMQSSAEHLSLQDRDEQFARMYDKLKNQLKAYPKEILGILVAKRDAIDDLRERFSGTELEDQVAFHDEDASFSDEARIHVMTVAAAKGTEFRAVHIYAAEDVQFPQNNQKFWYTAVTRAKTSLTAYSSPGKKSLSRILLAGFADDELPDLDSLFDE